MEEERSAPIVNQFPVAIDAHARVRLEEFYLFGVVPVERAGDFRIRAHGIAAERMAIGKHGGAHVLQDRRGRNVGVLWDTNRRRG